MTVRSVFNWLWGLPLALAGIGFAIANRQWIAVSFDPFNTAHPFAMINMPLWAVLFCGIFIGIFAGWMVSWINHGKYRKAARAARIELIRAQQLHERDKRDLQSSALVTRQDAAL